MQKIVGMAFVLILLPLAATAHEIKHSQLTIVHPWTSASGDPAPKDMAVRMRIKNGARSADRLVSASSPRAAKAELRSAEVGTVASITVPPHGEVVLGSGGTSVVLIGVAKVLTAYDTFPLTLVFDKSGAVTIDVMVEE